MVLDERVLDISAWLAALPISMEAANHNAASGIAAPTGGIMRWLQSGPDAMAKLAAHVAHASQQSNASFDLFKEVTLYAPVPRPGSRQPLSSLRLVLAIAANRPDILHVPHLAQGKVWIWNQEDDMMELKRRIAAARSFFKIDWQDIIGNIHVNSGVDKPLMLVARNDFALV